MQAIVALLSLPLMLLNALGGIVAGIWLLILGEWRLFFIGLVGVVVGSFLIGILLVPSMLISMPGAMLYERGGVARIFAYPMMAAGLLWTFIVMAAWAVGSFVYFLSRADESSFIPLLIWAYGFAAGPWTAMAARESQDAPSASAFTAFILQIACVTALIMLWPFGASPLSAITALLGILAVGFVLNIGMFIALVIDRRRGEGIR